MNFIMPSQKEVGKTHLEFNIAMNYLN